VWVIFEGLDKAGKGTLEREFLKATNFKHIVIDRGPAGYATFDSIFDRVTREGIEQYAKNVNSMVQSEGDFVVIYCKVPTDVAMKRLKEHNESCPYDYEFAQERYNEAIEMLYDDFGIKVITIDTTKSIEECVNLIVGGLK